MTCIIIKFTKNYIKDIETVFFISQIVFELYTVKNAFLTGYPHLLRDFAPIFKFQTAISKNKKTV